MISNSNPVLSIGIPVYNSVETVEKAIESLTKQTFIDIELIISDNCSNDGTYELLQKIASTDKRIKLTRQQTNIGAIKNFEFVLTNASGKYFMWAAADDFWLPDFIGENVNFLESNTDYVSSISKVSYDVNIGCSSKKMGTFPLNKSYCENVINYLMKPAANSRFYSVHRYQDLKKSWISDEFWAQDWAVICNLLEFGKFNELQRTLMIRGKNGASKKAFKTIYESKVLNRVDKLFPLYQFSLFILDIPPARSSTKVIFMLVIYNLVYTLRMIGGWVRLLLLKQFPVKISS